MPTPIESKDWTVRWTAIEHEHLKDTNHSANSEYSNSAGVPRPAFKGPIKAFDPSRIPARDSEEEPGLIAYDFPLIEGAVFCVRVLSNNTAEVEFKDNSTEQMRSVWAAARNIRYEAKNSTVRGDLFYNSAGEVGCDFAQHFLITHMGNQLNDDGKQYLHFLFLNEEDKDKPTSELLNEHHNPETTVLYAMLTPVGIPDDPVNHPPGDGITPVPHKHGSWSAD